MGSVFTTSQKKEKIEQCDVVKTLFSYTVIFANREPSPVFFSQPYFLQLLFIDWKIALPPLFYKLNDHQDKSVILEVKVFSG